MFEIKDPYILRPLPFLISSQEFRDSETVGLKDGVADDESQLDAGSLSSESEDEASRKGTITAADGIPQAPAAAGNLGFDDVSTELIISLMYRVLSST